MVERLNHVSEIRLDPQMHFSSSNRDEKPARLHHRHQNSANIPLSPLFIRTLLGAFVKLFSPLAGTQMQLHRGS